MVATANEGMFREIKDFDIHKMMDDVHKRHDFFIRYMLSNINYARCLFTKFLDENIKCFFDWATLEPIKSDFITGKLQEYIVDGLWKVKTKAHDAESYLLFEHQ